MVFSDTCGHLFYRQELIKQSDKDVDVGKVASNASAFVLFFMSRLDFSLLSALDWLFRTSLSQLCLWALQRFSGEQHQGSSALGDGGCFFYNVQCIIVIVFFVLFCFHQTCTHESIVPA